MGCSCRVNESRFILSGLSLSFAVLASAQTGSEPPSVEVIVARMAQARAENQVRLRPYVVTREYTLYGKTRAKSKSEVTAEIAFTPPNSKSYSIVKRSGSGLGERIVKRMLDGETKIVKDYGATDISPANYDFRLVGEHDVMGERCYQLELLPKRAEKTLLSGSMWIDAKTYLLRRMKVTPAKGASWWLRNVRIAFVYGDVEGMWLQTSSEFTTNVRIFGQYTMTSRDVEYEGVGVSSARLLIPETALQSDGLEVQQRPGSGYSDSLLAAQPGGK